MRWRSGLAACNNRVAARRVSASSVLRGIALTSRSARNTLLRFSGETPGRTCAASVSVISPKVASVERKSDARYSRSSGEGLPVARWKYRRKMPSSRCQSSGNPSRSIRSHSSTGSTCIGVAVNRSSDPHFACNFCISPSSLFGPFSCALPAPRRRAWCASSRMSKSQSAASRSSR